MAAIVLSQTGTAHANGPVGPIYGVNAVTPCPNLNSVKGGVRDENLRNFRTAFAEISQESHALIITEGAPVVKDLDGSQFAELQKSIAAAASDQSGDRLACVASAFDYDAVRFDDRTFLLLKRYRNSYELPLVTFEELAHSIRSILYLCDTYSPAPPQHGPTALVEFYASLTPEQKQQAKSGLSVGKLGETQRRLAAAAIAKILVEAPTSGLRDLSRVLTIFPQAKCSFQWVDAHIAMDKTLKAFGYAGNVGLRGSYNVFPLSAPFECFGLGAYNEFVLRPKRPALPIDEKGAQGQDLEGDPVAEKVDGVFTRDPTVPSRLDRMLAASSEMAARTDGALTLRQAARHVLDADPAANAGSSPISVGVNDAVADKPVNVFGLENRGDARHFLKALARVYGLQLLVDAHNHYQVTLPQPHIPDSPEGLPAEISRLTPPSLLNALAGRASAIKAKHPDAQDAGQEAPATDAKGPQTLGLAEYNQRRIMMKHAQPDAVESLYFSTARRLIAAAEPLVPTAASAPIPVAALAPESNRLIGLSMFCQESLIELFGLQRFVPPEILLSPERAIVQASSSESGDGQQLGISFRHLRDDGKLIDDGFAQGFIPNPFVAPRPQTGPPPVAPP